MQRTPLAKIPLLVGFIVLFGYFGIDKFIHPTLWIGWIPAWMDGFLGLPSAMWLSVIGVCEILCAVLLLIPVRRVQQTGAVLIALQLLSILPIAGFNDIGARDFVLMLSAITLWLLL